MKRPTLARKIFCIAALLCAAAWNANAVNLVADPGFEASTDNIGGNPFSASWTNIDPSGFSGVGGDSAFAHSGNNYAFLGASPGFGSLSQNLSTVVGQSYTLSFWSINDQTVGLPQSNSLEVPSVAHTSFFHREPSSLRLHAVHHIGSGGNWRTQEFGVCLQPRQ